MAAPRPPADEKIDIGSQDARQGGRGTPIVWVLVVSVVLAGLALLAVWTFHWGPFSQPGAQTHVTGRGDSTPVTSGRQTPDQPPPPVRAQ
jgi:hypothetical protein